MEEGAEKKRIISEEIKHELEKGGKLFISKFLLGFGVRAGIGVLSRVAHLALKNPSELRSLNAIFGEKKLIFREEAVRLGCFLGTFSALHSTLSGFLTIYFKRNPSRLQHFTIALSGITSSVASVLFLQRNTRLTLALYTFVRALQLLTYKLDELNVIQPYLSFSFPPSFNALIGESGETKKRVTIYEIIKYHFGSIVFILASAQIMYAYVMRKETLPSSYHAFIVRMGPISAPILLAARHIADRNFPLPLSQLRLEGKLKGYEVKIPCEVLHEGTSSCFKFSSTAWMNTFRKSFPMYLSIHLVSTLLFSYRRLFFKPLPSLLHLFFAVVRSSAFLGAFVFLYQSAVCTYGKIFTSDHKFKYYTAGVISSLAILMEKRSRREELGLYAMPYAFDSLRQLYSNYFSVFQKSKFGDVLLYSLSMTILLHFYQLSPHLLPNIVRSVFDKVLLLSAPSKAANVVDHNAQRDSVNVQ